MIHVSADIDIELDHCSAICCNMRWLGVVAVLLAAGRAQDVDLSCFPSSNTHCPYISTNVDISRSGISSSVNNDEGNFVSRPFSSKNKCISVVWSQSRDMDPTDFIKWTVERTRPGHSKSLFDSTQASTPLLDASKAGGE